MARVFVCFVWAALALSSVTLAQEEPNQSAQCGKQWIDAGRRLKRDPHETDGKGESTGISNLRKWLKSVSPLGKFGFVAPTLERLGGTQRCLQELVYRP